MFFSKNKGVKIKDVVFLGENGCGKAIGQWLQENADGIVAVWFQQELDKLRSALGNISAERFVLAERISYNMPHPVLFAGHYPLRKVEQELADKLGLKEITVYTHLDMPLLQCFGSEKIKEMMVKMGMAEDEPLSHAMITSAIGNAQDKIAAACITDMHATSEAEWMRMNMPQ
jgi:hypothetical protein